MDASRSAGTSSLNARGLTVKSRRVAKRHHDLYKLAETCNYGSFTNEMIRDRLVVRVLYSTLSERMQLDPDLNLERAKKFAQRRFINNRRT